MLTSSRADWGLLRKSHKQLIVQLRLEEFQWMPDHLNDEYNAHSSFVTGVKLSARIRIFVGC